MLEGRPIVVRFTWSDITEIGVRWEQAFSPDEGHTWEKNWIMEMTRVEQQRRSPRVRAMVPMMKLIELRNYLLGPGRTRDFIRYFEEHFLLSQRAEGMHPLGQFEVVGEPDRFVWIRGFDDMRTRLRGLSTFYSGPFWQARRAEANAMMLEHHNVHLLRPLGSIAALTGGATLEDRASEPPGAVPPETGLVVADFYRTEPAKLGRLVELFEERVRPTLLAARAPRPRALRRGAPAQRLSETPGHPGPYPPRRPLRLPRSRALRRHATRLAQRRPGPAGNAAASDRRGGVHPSAADRQVADSLPR